MKKNINFFKASEIFIRSLSDQVGLYSIYLHLSLYFVCPCGVSKGIMKAFKAFIKPFETPLLL